MNDLDESSGTGDLDHIEQVFRSEPVIPLQPRPGEFDAVWAASRRGAGRRRGLLVLAGAAAAAVLAVAVIGGTNLLDEPEPVPAAAPSLDCTPTELAVSHEVTQETELLGQVFLTFTNTSDRDCRVLGPTAVSPVTATGAELSDLVAEPEPGDPVPPTFPVTLPPDQAVTTSEGEIRWSTGIEVTVDGDAGAGDPPPGCLQVSELVVQYAGTGEYRAAVDTTVCQ